MTEELFKKAVEEACRQEIEEIEKIDVDITPSKDFKRRINNLFREQGITKIPHPEADD